MAGLALTRSAAIIAGTNPIREVELVLDSTVKTGAITASTVTLNVAFSWARVSVKTLDNYYHGAGSSKIKSVSGT